MKPFLLWFLLSLAAFAGLAAGYHISLSGEPRRIAVIIDSSFEMSDDWHRVPVILNELSGRRYTRYLLATEKGLIHEWEASPRLGRAKPYAPRNFDRLQVGEGREAVLGADEVVFITNAPDSLIETFDDWTVVRP